MAETAENLAELYYAKLRTGTNTGLVLAQFYSALTGKNIGRAEVISFNRLLKVFGKSNVFMAIIDVARLEEIPEFPYGLFYKICKDRLEASIHTEMTSASSDNLDRKVNELIKESAKIKKIDPERAGKFLDEGDK